MHGAFKAHAVYPFTSSLILTCRLYNIRSISSVLQGYKVDIGKLFTNRPKDKGLKQDIHVKPPGQRIFICGRVEIATIPVCQEVI